MAIITVENLGKRYMIRHQAEVQRYNSLRDTLAAKARGLLRRDPGRRAATKEEFWALRGLDFEIAAGETVGIVGRNGAGKSTLLKVLSRITEPSEGRVTLRGRVASLLEIGTGFHPELTGRENIFLNGAILGMTRQEIRARFDDIVAFAEVERFLDTPVKRYSSGMYVRLAFAVAAHLEPEILIVDEVLAVGDAEFQKRCLGKMSEVSAGQGRTVLFVSHNMSAVQSLCARCIYLRGGRVAADGPTGDVVPVYLHDSFGGGERASVAGTKLGPDLVLDEFSFSPSPAESLADLDFAIRVRATGDTRVLSVVFDLYSALGAKVGQVDLRTGEAVSLAAGESCEIRGTIHKLPLVCGEYTAGFYVETPSLYEHRLDLVNLVVNERAATENVVPYNPSVRGSVEFEASFTVGQARREPALKGSGCS